jgi:hypothetical protein
MTNTHTKTDATNDADIAAAAKRYWASEEPASTSVPSFQLTWDSAARRNATRPTASRLRWSVVAMASMAIVAVAALLATNLRSPTLQDDIALARSVSFESVWHSPSDRLLAHAPSAVMRDMPDMPQLGTPNLVEEYL